MDHKLLIFPSRVKLGLPMATYVPRSRPSPWRQIARTLAEMVTFALLIVTTMVVCYVLAPPVDEPRPEVSYLPTRTK